VLTLCWMELRQLLRTRALFNCLLLPSLLSFPVFFALVNMFVFANSSDTTIAISGAPLPVTASFLENDLILKDVPDPLSSLAAQEVDVAVHDWIAGDGIGDARGEQLHTRWRWRVSVASESERAASDVEDALEEAAEDWLEAAVLAAGGVLDHDLWLLRIRTLHESGAEEETTRSGLQQDIFGWVLMIALMGGLFVISVQGIADRESGVAEQFRVAPVQEGSRMLARLLAVTLVELVAIGMLMSNLALLMGSELSLGGALLGCTKLLTGLLLINTASILVGELSDNVEHLMNITGAPLLLVGFALLFVGLKWSIPWLPLAGLIQAETGAEILVAVSATTATAALVFLATMSLHRWQGSA